MDRIKIAIVGSCGSGKSTIANYLYDPTGFKLSIYRPTVGVRILEIERFIKYSKNPNGENIIIELWDVSGDIEYEKCWPMIKKGIDGVIFVSNADAPFKEQEFTSWIKSFAKDINIKPSKCIAFSHHTNGKNTESGVKKFKGLKFVHSCIEDGTITINAVFDKFLSRLLDEINN